MSTPSTKSTEIPTRPERPPASMRNVGLILAIMAAVAAADQLIKQWVLDNLELGTAYPVIGDWFRFYLIFNPGAAFGMGEDSTWLFTTIQLVFSLGVLVASPFIRDRGVAVGLAMIGGGALGNLIDRLLREPGFWFGHVVDYISVGNFAIFNLADASISVGVVVFFIAMLLEDRRESRTRSPETTERGSEEND
ncbi:signal peptidase II [Corynebacterium guangdongense]|uniref:Lipoprotein signal peptidase n=1 Tax=Corynebacterium guangdongense TaxID=1783348 RepID=A0ABU1ZXQ6_9CORY|nr:signal peptidase II [Corynebacterium guangdongense]